MQFLRNLAINLNAKGPAAVIIVWVVCVTALGLLGSGPLASKALTLLAVARGAMLLGLVHRL